MNLIAEVDESARILNIADVADQFRDKGKKILLEMQRENSKARKKRMREASKKVAVGLVVAGTVILAAFGVMQM